MKEEWKKTIIGEICDVGGGSTPRRTDKTLWDNGTYPWFTVEDIREQGRIISYTRQSITEKAWKTMRVFPANSVLLCCTASIGEYALTTIPITTNQQFNGLTIKDSIEVLPMFLLYYCSTLKDKLLSLSGRTTINFVSGEKVRNLPFSFPSLSEQQRIVALLDAEFAKIDALKANAEKNLQNTKDLFQAALKKELEPKEGWTKKKLNDLYDVRDGTHDSPKYQERGFPLVTSKNLRNGFVDMANVKYISQQDYDKINERSKVDIGDVLFAMIGTIGNPSLVVEEPNYAIKNMALFKVPLTQSGSLLRYVLSSNQVLDEMHNKAKGSNQPFVSLGYLRNFEITIPQTLEEQNSLVCKLDILDERCKALQANYEKTLGLCDDLKQALLRKAFNGEI